MVTSVANSSTHNLHRILSAVRAETQANLRVGWTNVLQAEWGTYEFSRRHSEVVSLLNDTIEGLHSLPDHARDRSIRYVSAWWVAVVHPEQHWEASNAQCSSIIEDSALDQLEAVGDLISGAVPGTMAAPRGQNLAELAEECSRWIEILDSIDSGELSDSFKRVIATQLEHVIWLIDNVELFGVSRVAREANRVIGTIAQASTEIQDASPDTRAKWGKAVAGLIAACVFFTTGANTVQDAINAGQGAAKEIVGVIQDISDGN